MSKDLEKYISCPECRGGLRKPLWGKCIVCKGEKKVLRTTTVEALIKAWQENDDD